MRGEINGISYDVPEGFETAGSSENENVYVSGLCSLTVRLRNMPAGAKGYTVYTGKLPPTVKQAMYRKKGYNCEFLAVTDAGAVAIMWLGRDGLDNCLMVAESLKKTAKR